MPDAVRILKDGAAGSTAADEGSTLGSYPLDGELDTADEGLEQDSDQQQRQLDRGGEEDVRGLPML